MKTSRLKIVNRLGFHARAAARFVQVASTFRSAIEIHRDGDVVDGKSILGILALAASRGSWLELTATGPDEIEAVAALEALVLSGFGEGE
ncbi:MAG: HPr family phosphocarrier protein [Acidobacteria bacterium]|nr:HPr family phosphocarrier protein [Acidobacteriota bacterium]